MKSMVKQVVFFCFVVVSLQASQQLAEKPILSSGSKTTATSVAAQVSPVSSTYRGTSKQVTGPLRLEWVHASCWFNTLLQLFYSLQPHTLDLLLGASDNKPGGREIREFFNQVFAGTTKKNLEAVRFAAQKAVCEMKIPYEIDEDGDVTYIELDSDGSEVLVLDAFYERFGWKNLKNSSGAPLIDLQKVQWQDLGNLSSVLARSLRGQEVLILDVATQTFEKRIYKYTAKKGQRAAELQYYDVPLVYTSPYGVYELVSMSVTQAEVAGQFYTDYHSFAIVKERSKKLPVWYFADDDDDQARQYRKIDNPKAHMSSYRFKKERIPVPDVQSFIVSWPKFEGNSLYYPGVLVYEKQGTALHPPA